MVLRVNGTERGTWSVAAGESYTPYFARTPLTGGDVFEIWYTNDNAVRELWVDAVMVGGPAPLPYHASLPAVRHATGTPQPPPTDEEGVTVQAEGGAMLYGRGAEATAFADPNVVPGQERLDEAGALRFAVGSAAYAAEYDANGNMTSRVVAGQAQVLEWDAENRLVGITQGASVSSFVYDADGNRVKATVDGVSTVYIGGYYEETAGAARTYYYRGGQRVAMREAGVTTWLLGDHLGSTSVAYSEASGESTSQGYYAWGTIRPGPENELPTDYTFTGQKLDERSGLMYYVARWYDAFVGRFLSPDTIVPAPGDPQDWNRFSYVNNNPIGFSDPTGHAFEAGAGVGGGSEIELYLAYKAAASRVDPVVGPYIYGHLVEHLSYVAQYHLDMATKDPATSPDAQLSLEGSYRTSSRVAINGAYGANAAVSEAYTAAGGEAAAGLGLATGLYNLVCPPVWGSLGIVPNPGGINGAPDHQATVARLKGMAAREFKGRDVIIEANRSILEKLGKDRRPDVSVWDAKTGELLKVYEAARLDARGNFAAREQQKMFEYWEAGIQYWFEEVK